MRKKDQLPLVFIAALTLVIIIAPGLDWPWRIFIAFMAAWPISLVSTVISDAFRKRKNPGK